MPRLIKIAAAQIGAIDRTTSRSTALSRASTLLRSAAAQSVQLVVFPELALTTFFPRYLLTGSELASFFSTQEPLTDPHTAPLFALAGELGVDIVLGFAEREADAPEDGRGYNSCVYYSACQKRIVARYRKVHLPGTVEPFEDPEAINQLEKRYFAPGDGGFEAFRAPGLVDGALKAGDVRNGEKTDGRGDALVGMLICNDRRWPEAWRALTLQGAELVVFGYNTGAAMAHLWGNEGKGMSMEDQKREALWHSRLVQQANSYMHACFSVSAARCGLDDGKYELIAGSCIVGPEGHVLAEAKTEGDELIIADIDLEDCRQGKQKVSFVRCSFIDID